MLKARIQELEAILATSNPTATSILMAQHARKDSGTMPAVHADAQKPEESFRFQDRSRRIVKTKRIWSCRLKTFSEPTKVVVVSLKVRPKANFL